MKHPPHADDWEGLALVAARLRDDRARGDSEEVKAGRLTQQQADDRARVSAALTMQWRAIASREPMPWLDASYAEIRADLTTAAAATAKRAASRPDAVVQLGAGNVSYAVFAEAVAALLWQQQPYRDCADLPRIVFVHSINELSRAERAAQPSKPAKPAASAPHDVPPAPPLRQPALFG